MTNSHNLPRLYKGGFFFGLHYALISYASSSYLERFLSPNQSGFVFSAGSFLGVALVLASLFIWKRNSRLLLALVLPLIIFLLVLLALLPYKEAVGTIFAMYLGLNFLGWFLFDVAIEHDSADKKTGTIRGSYLTFVNIAWLFSPLISGILITESGFKSLFLVSSAMGMITLLILKKDIPKAINESRKTLALRPDFWIANPEVKKVLFVNFILQFFYSAMVVVAPIYLIHELGIGWETLGKIFFIMLLPFVLVDYPMGRLADKKGNEKKILLLGLSIMAFATIAFGLWGATSIFAAAIILYFTRVGASIVEIMADSYFFKHVGERNLGSIALYRSMTPVAFLLGPIFGLIYSSALSYGFVFITVGTIVLLSTIVATRIKNI